MSWLAAALLPLVLMLAGSRMRPLLADPERPPGAAYRAVLSLLAGLVLFHLALILLSAAGIPWSRLTLAPTLILLAWLPGYALRGRQAPPGAAAPAALGWGDAVALLAVLCFALLAPTLWITNADFVHHWGLKGEKFFLARGVDYAFLGQGWNGIIHPDYPNLLPELYAATAILGDRWHAPALMTWSVLFLLLAVAAARDALRQAGVERWMRQAGVALVGLVAAAYGMGLRMAGAADGMMALALAAALPPLLAPSGRAAAVQVGVVAAFAASAKIEGVPLAAFLLLAFAAARWREGGARAAVRAVLPGAGLVAAVTLPWLALNLRHGLFQASNSGPFDWRRGREVLPAMLEAMSAPELHGLPFLVVLLLPLLWAARRTRPVAAVITAQLLFYGWAYFASALEPRFYVLSNFARLLFHLLPALLAGAVVALGGGVRREG